MVYESMKQCATKTGTDYKLIKAAKSHKDAPGFNVGGSGSQRIDWDLLGPWIDAHRDELENSAEKASSMDALKRERLELENAKRRIEVEKLKGRLVDAKEFDEWMGQLGAIASATQIATMKNLMEQCAGYESVIKNAFLELIDTTRREFSEWSKK